MQDNSTIVYAKLPAIFVDCALNNSTSELRERIFQYRMNNTTNLSEKSRWVRERTLEIHRATLKRQLQMQALLLAKQSGEITQKQFEAMIHLFSRQTSKTDEFTNGLRHITTYDGHKLPDDADIINEGLQELNQFTRQADGKGERLKHSGGFHLINEYQHIGVGELKKCLEKLSHENKIVRIQAISDIKVMCDNHRMDGSLLNLIVNSPVNQNGHLPLLLRLLCRQNTLWHERIGRRADEKGKPPAFTDVVPKNIRKALFQSNIVENAWEMASDFSNKPGHRNLALKYLRLAEAAGQYGYEKDVYNLALKMAMEENDAYEYMDYVQDAIVKGVLDNNERRLQINGLLESGDVRVKKRGKDLMDLTTDITVDIKGRELVEKEPKTPERTLNKKKPSEPEPAINETTEGIKTEDENLQPVGNGSDLLHMFSQDFAGSQDKTNADTVAVNHDDFLAGVSPGDRTFPELEYIPTPEGDVTVKLSAASTTVIIGETSPDETISETDIDVSTEKVADVTDTGDEGESGEFTIGVIGAGDVVKDADVFTGETVNTIDEDLCKVETTKHDSEGLEPLTFEPPDGYELVESYWINPPHCCANIFRRSESLENIYYLVEPELDGFAQSLLSKLGEHLRDMLARGRIDENEERSDILDANIEKLLHIFGIKINDTILEKIRYYLHRDFIGYGKIDGFMRDPNIEDISCDGVRVPVFLYLRKYQNIVTNFVMEEDELDSMVIKLAQKCGKHVSIGSPVTQATMPDGSRLEATFGREVTTRGSSFTIRRFRHEPFTPVDLVNNGTYSTEMLAYLWLVIENNQNFIVAGGTASGKTSTLNALSIFIPPSSKIVSIEDTRELTLYHQNWIAKVTRNSTMESSGSEINMYDLLRSSLRERPEYILVGEVRGREAQVLFQAMNTGHTTYSTMHAGSVQAVVNRLLNEPINVPTMMFQSLNVVLVQALTYDAGHKTRRCNQIVEITDVDQRTGNLSINEMFRWSPHSSDYEQKSSSYVLKNIQKDKGWNAGELENEISNRVKVINYLIDNDIARYSDVAPVIESYYRNPQFLMSRIENGELKTTLNRPTADITLNLVKNGGREKGSETV